MEGGIDENDEIRLVKGIGKFGAAIYRFSWNQMNIPKQLKTQWFRYLYGNK